MITLHCIILVLQSLMLIAFSTTIQWGKPNKYTYYGWISSLIFIIYEVYTLHNLTQ